MKQTTEFQEKVYAVLKKIPEGRVSTYKLVGKAMNSKGYRAIGSACNRNPYSPIVPCHRVVNSNGMVGGFARGMSEKIKMLEKEGIKVVDGKVVDFEKKVYSC